MKDPRRLDDADRRIIRATQSGLPLIAEPYQAIGEQIGLSADEVMSRLNAMLQAGIIRRIGVVPNHYRIGYRANGMTVWDVEDAWIDEMGVQVGALSFVSHCYHRPRSLPEWPYNLFAMVHAHGREQVEDKARQIGDLLGSRCRGHATLYSTRILKKTGLRISE